MGDDPSLGKCEPCGFLLVALQGRADSVNGWVGAVGMGNQERYKEQLSK